MEPVSSTVTAVLATLRVAREAAKQLKSTELSEKLQEVHELVADLRQHLFNLEDENRRLQSENEGLRSTKEIEEQMSYEGEVYFRTADGKKTGPYCPLCWDADRKLVRTQLASDRRHFCNLHKVSFSNPGHETSNIAIAIGGPSIWDKQF